MILGSFSTKYAVTSRVACLLNRLLDILGSALIWRVERICSIGRASLSHPATMSRQQTLTRGTWWVPFTHTQTSLSQTCHAIVSSDVNHASKDDNIGCGMYICDTPNPFVKKFFIFSDKKKVVSDTTVAYVIPGNWEWVKHDLSTIIQSTR